MAHAPIVIAAIAFCALLALRLFLALRKRQEKTVGRRGADLFVVRKHGRFRELVIMSPTHEQVQSRQDLRNELSSGRGYVDGFHVAMIGRPSARRALFLGGGACVGPRQFEAAYPGLQVDVVESEALVVDAARTHFGLRESERLAVHVADARAFVKTATPYDVVVIDCYDAYRMPGHLLTAEFFAEVRAVVTGAVVLNLVGNPKRTLVPAILAGLARAFPEWKIAVFAVPDEAGGRHPISNFIVLVTPSLPELAGASVAVAPFLPEIVAGRIDLPIDPERAYADATSRTWVPVTE